MASFRAAVPIMPAVDLPRALAFYRERLGFQELFRTRDYAGVGRDGVEIHLALDSGRQRYTAGCRIRVRELASVYASCRAQGLVEPAMPLEAKPWGLLEFGIRDVEGNLLTFFEPVHSASSGTS